VPRGQEMRLGGVRLAREGGGDLWMNPEDSG